MRTPLWGVALGLLLSACEYQDASEVPDASGPFLGAVTLIWAPTSNAVTADFTTPQFKSSLQQLQLPDSSCIGSVVGSCCVYGQPALDITTGDIEPITASAGLITVDDDSGGGAQALGSFNFAGIGYYPMSSAETPTLLWNPGDTLAVSATGGLIAGFSGSITAPPAFSGVSPALSIAAQVVVPIAKDFTITWTPGPDADGGGPVTVDFFDPSGFYADCTAPDSAGSVTASAAAFASFLPGDNGYVTLYRPVSQTIPGTDQMITLTAEATDPGLATFQ